MALSFIKSSGNIITEDFCMALAKETKADYVKDKSFGADMKKVDDTIASTFEKLRERWEENRTQIIENEFDNATLRKKWVLPFLEALGYQPIFMASNIKSESGTEYHIPYKGWDSDYAPLIHMVNSLQDFDTKDKNSRTHSNKSPQDCLQQFLNTSHHQWAIIINGKKVRLLLDFYHSITKGFLEFDLESIFETANSEQFRVLYRILHSSRIENQYQGKQEIEYDEEGNPIEVEDNCLLESFHKKSRETGVKVGNKLRDQVIEAIEKLGNGFAESLDPDEFQNGKVKGFYAEILNIIYRLLFLMFAEQKGWLPVRNSIYARTYSLNALREMAERGNYSHDEEHDLWEGLKITFKLVANGYKFENGDEINAFGGQLFSDKKIAVIKKLSLKNKYLLDAIFRLSYFKLDNLSNRINYANLAIDELGSVYESLLDYEPKLAQEPSSVQRREIKRGEFYLDDRGTDRKTTGSYYTDSRLVAQLIESALVPVINNALSEKNTIEEKEHALLDLKVADIACGSGAFICAALEKMGERLAIIRMGEEERPTEDQLREAKRDVLLHCIYGVDLNPMALELAKFSLWITASLPDMPLTFLDHKLKCGNSLIGATPKLIKKGIPEAAYKPVGNDNPAICSELKKKVRREQESLSRVNEPTSQYGIQFKRNETDELLRLRVVLNNRKQEEVADVDLAEEEYHQLEKMERKFKDWLMADVWTSAFFIEKTELDQTLYPTNVTLENLRENQPVNEVLIDRVLKTADHYNFFHYHLEFPEVFEKGGFDCLLGNPPWERVKLEEKEFFSVKSPEISVASKENRERLIQKLEVENPVLYSDYISAKNEAEANIKFLNESSRYPLMSGGDVNTYTVFTEGIFNLLNNGGFCGLITPSGIASDDGTKEFFQKIINNKNLSSLYDFENKKGLFYAVHRMFKFCLLTLSKKQLEINPIFVFYALDIDDIKNENKRIPLTFQDFNLFNPNSKTAVIIRSLSDYKLLKRIYNNSKVLLNEQVVDNVYALKTMSAFHMTNTASEFKTFNVLKDDGYQLNQSVFIKDDDHIYLPLIESKMIWIYDHRYATFNLNGTSIEYVQLQTKRNIEYETLSRYWLPKTMVWEKFKDENSEYKWIIVVRDITAATNERTFVSTICPPFAIANSLSCIVGIDEKSACFLLSNFNSFVFDYAVRQKMNGSHINFWILKQLPIIDTGSLSEKLQNFIISNVKNLCRTSNSMETFITLPNDNLPTIWNDKERFQLQCELDAIYAHLYGLEKEEMDYILDTFPIVKRKDIAKYGSYRSKETILQLYDEFAWVKEEMATVDHTSEKE
jgi:hypothetical protein